MQTIRKWHKTNSKGSDYEAYFISKSNEFKKYTSNMYLLNRACLKIQHAFYKYKMRVNGEKDDHLLNVNADLN